MALGHGDQESDAANGTQLQITAAIQHMLRIATVRAKLLCETTPSRRIPSWGSVGAYAPTLHGLAGS
jgi:hypothetical protein